VVPVAFLVLNTSPGIFQAWVAIANESGATDADFARRLRKAAGADPTASGATRVVGTANFKAKYAPACPIVQITAAEPGRIVTRADLEARGLVPAPELVKAPQPRKRNSKGREVAELSILRRSRPESARRRPPGHQPRGFHMVHERD
jgi:hypothetical protein